MKTVSNSSRGKSARSARLLGAGVLAVSLFVGAAVRGGQAVSIAWDASQSTGVAGYTVYRGTTSGVYTNTYDTGTNLALTLTGLPEGQTNYFKVVAYNAARMTGTMSSELSYIVPGVVRVSAPAKAGNPASICFPVAVAHTYSIQASTDLSVWATIYTTTSCTSNAWVTYQDPQTSAFPHRYYRLILN